jgi:FkbM family methyltransferase
MNSLNDNISFDGIDSIETVATLYHEFFIRNDYDWWYKVQPNDVVVDIGACNGMFTCHALDNGAKKVYSIEGNSKLIKTVIHNASPHIINKKESPLVPINCVIGNDPMYARNIFGEGYDKAVPIRSFKDIIKEYDITHIDYLKIDAEGAEYDILSEENLEFIKNNVKHIAVEIHLDCFEGAPALFKKFRDNFLSKFDASKIKYLHEDSQQKMYDDAYLNSKWPLGWGSCWMIYICNKSL